MTSLQNDERPDSVMQPDRSLQPQGTTRGNLNFIELRRAPFLRAPLARRLRGVRHEESPRAFRGEI